MTKEEILSYLSVGSTRSVCVDCSLSKIYPNTVRTITITNKANIIIEFDTYGYDEGGVNITIKYNNINILIQYLEKYLDLKLEHWENFTKSGKYPEKLEVDFNAPGNKLKRDVLNKTLSLPLGGIEYTMKGAWCKNRIIHL